MTSYEYEYEKKKLENMIERNQREMDDIKKNYSAKLYQMEYNTNKLKDNFDSEELNLKDNNKKKEEIQKIENDYKINSKIIENKLKQNLANLDLENTKNEAENQQRINQIKLDKINEDYKNEEKKKKIENDFSINMKKKQTELEDNLNQIQIQLVEKELDYKLKTLEQNKKAEYEKDQLDKDLDLIKKQQILASQQIQNQQMDLILQMLQANAIYNNNNQLN